MNIERSKRIQKSFGQILSNLDVYDGVINDDDDDDEDR